MQAYMQNQMCVKKWLEYHGLHNFFIEDIQRSILDYFNKLDPLVVSLADGGKTFLHWDFRKGVSKEDREYFMMYLKGGE